MSAIAPPAKTMRSIQRFEAAQDRMAVTQEAWEDVMAAFDGDDMDAEEDSIVNQIMDELGLQLGSSMPSAPVTANATPIEEVRYSSTLFRMIDVVGHAVCVCK